MSSRNYDVVLTVTNTASFATFNVVVGNSSQTIGTIAGIDTSNNLLKVKLANIMQEFYTTEYIHSNVIVTTGTANSVLNSNALPFQSNTMTSNITQAITQISAISPSNFIAEKNAFVQNPIVRLYTVYFPGEWYPPNSNGNPTGKGTGRAWPNDFPIQFAEIVGDITDDLSYNVSFGGSIYTPFPVTSSGLEQGSDGKINELSLSIYNMDNIISRLVEDPYLVGNNISNSVMAMVNNELLHGIDPRTVNALPADMGTEGSEAYDVLTRAHANGLVYSSDIVDLYGRANATFNKEQTDSVGGIWQPLKIDSRDLQGALVEIKTTFANFLDVWPEYSLITTSLGNLVTIGNSLPYRVGDWVRSSGNTYVNSDNVEFLSSYITTAREGPTYGQDANNNLVVYGANELAFTYLDGVKYLLVEEAANNILPYSSNFYAWSLANNGLGEPPSVDIIATNSPGGYEASFSTLFNKVTNTDADYSTITMGYNCASATEYTASIFIKANSISDENKVVGIRPSDTANITLITLTNTFVRVSSTFISNNTSSNISIGTFGNTLTDTSVTAILSAASIEAGSNVSSYIPTAASSATRFADIMTLLPTQNANTLELDLEVEDNVDIQSYTFTLDSNNTWPAINSHYIKHINAYGANTYNVLFSINFSGNSIIEVRNFITQITNENIYMSNALVSYPGSIAPLYIINADRDPDSFMEDKYRIDQLESLSEDVATFGLISWLQYFKMVIPKRKFYKNTCQWQYKGDECQYPGPGGLPIPGDTLLSNTNPISANNEIASNELGDVCSKSFRACSLRNNQIHYGGFSGVGRTVPKM